MSRDEQVEASLVRLDAGSSRLVLRNAVGFCQVNLETGALEFGGPGSAPRRRLRGEVLVETEQRRQLASQASGPVRWTRVKPEAGMRVAVEFSRPLAASFHLHWRIAAAANGFVLRVGVSGGCETVVGLGLACDAGFLGGARRPHMLQVAYCGAHSQSPLSRSEVRPVAAGTRGRSWWATAWFDAADETGFVLGFLSAERLAGRFDLAGFAGTALNPVERVRPPAHRILWAEPLWLAPAASTCEALAEYGRQAGRVTGRVTGAGLDWGWGSWGHFTDVIDGSRVMANARAVRELQVPADTGPLIHVDHGWEEQFRTHRPKASWLPRRQFGHDIPSLVRRLHADGARLGLWVVPFALNVEGALPRAWQTAVLPDGLGRRRPVLGEGCYCLDPTSPGGEAWLRRLFGRLTRMGASHFKLDFLRVLLAHDPDDPTDGLTRPRCFHQSMTRVEAYRHGLGIIRDTVGARAHLLACGAPLLPSAGLVDSCRIGSDIEPAWEHGGTGIRACAENVRCNFFWHGQVWHNDPDFLLAPGAARLQRYWAAAVAFSGGRALVSADLPALSVRRLMELRRFLPSLPGAPRPLGLAPDAGITRVSRVLSTHGETASFIALFNHDGQSRVARVSVDDFAPGFTGPGLAWDVLAGQPAGRAGRAWRVAVPAGDVRILCIRRVLDRPQLAGTSGHVGMDLTELAAVTWNAGAGELRCTRTATGVWPERLYFRVPATFRPAPGAGITLDRRTRIATASLRQTRSRVVGFSFLSTT